MAKYMAVIKTKIGAIIINFDSLKELESSVESLDINAISDVLWKKFESIIVKEIRQPKPGYEDIYRFTPDGLIEILNIPESKAETVALVLFAYYPEAATIQQIALSSGIRNVASDYLSHKNYRKYWWKTEDGKYVLSQEGLEWVTKKIIPNLKPQKIQEKKVE
jgi:hypothetical protein